MGEVKAIHFASTSEFMLRIFSIAGQKGWPPEICKCLELGGQSLQS